MRKFLEKIVQRENYFDHFAQNENGDGAKSCFTDIQIRIMDLSIELRCKWFNDIRMTKMVWRRISFEFDVQNFALTEAGDPPTKRLTMIEPMKRSMFSISRRFDRHISNTTLVKRTSFAYRFERRLKRDVHRMTIDLDRWTKRTKIRSIVLFGRTTNCFDPFFNSEA